MNNFISQIIPFMPPYKIGYAPRMICDKPRNQYYNKLLEQCRGKICADIGFGTGLLTIIALYNGAKHVYAYEQDEVTFEFGKAIIENMGFSDKVTFINDRYSPFYNEEIVFHEIVDRSLWGEGIRNVKFPQDALSLPSTLTCKIHYSENADNYIKQRDGFMDIGLEYLVESYNKSIEDVLCSEKYTCYDNIDKTIFNTDGMLGSYTHNIGNTVNNTIEVNIKIPKDNCVIWCENFIDNFRLMDGHWRADKVIHVSKAGDYKFIHNTDNGSWWLE